MKLENEEKILTMNDKLCKIRTCKKRIIHSFYCNNKEKIKGETKAKNLEALHTDSFKDYLECNKIEIKSIRVWKAYMLFYI